MELDERFEWNGRLIACGRAGSGPPVVFCHGTPFSSRVWSPYADALSRDFTVHLWDMPGYGQSSKNDGDRVDFGSQAAAFAALLEHWVRADDLDALVEPWLGAEGQSAFYRQIADYDEEFLVEIERHLGELAMPVHVVWGEADAWIPVGTGRRLAGLIPGARFTTVPGAGHLVQYDAPAALADLLRTWVSS